MGLMAACATPEHTAPVVERTPQDTKATPTKRVDTQGFYTVQRGDTLYRVALAFNQSYRDIVAWNNLVTPDDIKVGQVLRVQPPEGGAQVGAVSGSGVEVRPLDSPPGSAKTSPRGDKQPYSEENLGEMQKPGSDAGKSDATSKAGAAGSAAAASGIDWLWPAQGKIVSTFAQNKKGVDIGGTMGQPVLAAGPGTVLYASSVRGYGNLVIIKHVNNLLSAYAHNKTILVKEGQSVSRGQRIAEMGSSDTDSVKLHFEIRQQGKPVDPIKFLPVQ